MKRLLLDTHTLLWFANDDVKLPRVAYELIVDRGNQASVSVASIWELAIKVSIKKLTLDDPLDEFVFRELKGFQVLPILVDHALQSAKLHLVQNRDPFDRILAAQAIQENLAIVSANKVFDDYGVRRIWNADSGLG